MFRLQGLGFRGTSLQGTEVLEYSSCKGVPPTKGNLPFWPFGDRCFEHL